MEQPLEVKVENEAIQSTVWHIDGIRLGHGIYRTRSERPPPSSPSIPSPDVVRLHFGLRGNYSFTYRQLAREFHLIGGHHNLMYSREFNIEVQPHSPELEIFGVQFDRERFIQFTQNAGDALQRFSENILEGKNILFSEHWGAIDTQIEQVIRQITHCTYGGDLKRLFLLSKSIELLVLSADACSAAQKDKFIKSRTDMEKIIAVRDLVNARIDNPPNLSEIARMVGLNEYKLKRGFKETFQTTIFEYLSEQRLQIALQSLLDTEKTAAEISAELGYSSPQHFNNAFRKKFGKTPQSVRKNP